MTCKELLDLRNLPAIPSDHDEILSVLKRELFGEVPPPVHATATIDAENPYAYAGKATERNITVSFETPNGEFSFPVNVYIPNAVEKPKVFLHICFLTSMHRYNPIEEIIDNGYALAVACYLDIASDDDKFDNGLALKYPRVSDTDWGKIGMWAYGMQRLLDVLVDWDIFSDYAIVGHSRLGKTALWCGATDPRFSLAVSNDSGCSGASLARGGNDETRETVAKIVRQFPYWFCKNYWQYADHEDLMPFDQHWLIAANAPHRVLVNSAEEDLWADPDGEYLSCVAASAAFEAMGKPGLIADSDELPPETCYFGEGSIGYSRRPGRHFFSRYDWNTAMRFWREKE